MDGLVGGFLGCMEDAVSPVPVCHCDPPWAEKQSLFKNMGADPFRQFL